MKKYVIDGHNLIPKIPGLSLSQLDDELRLLELLEEYSRKARVHLEVFFDGAPPTQAGTRKGGLIHTHFVRQGITADDAIIDYLNTHTHERDRLILVSSDARIISTASHLKVTHLKSEQFSRDIMNTIQSSNKSNSNADSVMRPDELEEWLRLFNQKKP